MSSSKQLLDMDNKGIADLLEEIGELLSLDEKPTTRFEVRAYKKAALTIATLQEPVEDVYAKGGLKALMELPGIGKSIAGHIEEYIKTGKVAKYEELKAKYPIDMKGLTSVMGLGAKRAVLLYEKLGVKDVEGLKKAVEKHRIRGLEGFGERSEDAIKKGLSFLEGAKGRMLLGDVYPVAESLVRRLEGSGRVEKALIAGSLRRMRETIGDIDILAISKDAPKAMDFFIGLEDVQGIVAKGDTKTTVRLKLGLTCDLRILDPESFGAAVQYFTGSKDHNIKVRTIAIKNGYKLNEYGLFDRKGRNVGGRDEESIYGKLGMQYMPPEMREDRGEVELALQHRIPKLVEEGDIRGDMHTHTKETDGMVSLEEMVGAAAERGLDYIAITNHTKSLRIANGMDDAGFERFFGKIDALNAKRDDIRVLKGGEVDILRDGSLDLKKKTLEGMDCVVAAVHSATNMPKGEMTGRIVKALDSGLVSILAHPTGRLINEREAYEVDLDKVAEAAERDGVALEINAFPSRIDLNDTNIMLASRYKVLFAIDTDAHNTSHLQFMRYGVGTARRGWLTKQRVLNALPLEKALKAMGK